MQVRRVGVLLVGLLCWLAPGPVQAQGIPTKNVSLPTNASGNVGDSITVSLNIDEAGGLLGARLIITYDDAILNATGASNAGTLSDGMTLTPNFATSGRIVLLLSTSGSPLNPTGPGSLIDIMFDVIGPGSSTLAFTDLPNPPGAPIPRCQLEGEDSSGNGIFFPCNTTDGLFSTPCGNGQDTDPGEECDDGNTTGGDGCSATCQIEECGDGIVQVGLGEQCDDGGTVSEDGCSAICLIEECGDGTVQAGLGEQCDDSNTDSGDGCSDTCQIEVAASGLDHYMFYRTRTTRNTPRFFKFGPLLLKDQFNDVAGAEYDVVRPTQLGLPANKNDEGVFDADTHLMEYKLQELARGSGKFQKRNVLITNQCNTDLILEVQKPESILVPSNKDVTGSQPGRPDPATHDVDHFLCYKARTPPRSADGTRLPRFPRGIQVEVVDQFDGDDPRRYDLRKVTKLCNPVDKSGTPILRSGPNRGGPFPNPLEGASIENADAHLVCYQAVLSTSNIVQNECGPADPTDRGTRINPRQARHTKLENQVVINNQFRPERLDTIKETEFCIPSQKTFPIP